MKYVTKTTTTMAVVLAIAVPLIVIPTSAMAWPYYGVGGGVGGYDEAWRGGGYHGSWGFHGPYCGGPGAWEPCYPQAYPVPVPAPYPVPVAVPTPVPVPVPSCGCVPPPPPCGCGGGISSGPIATPYYGGEGPGPGIAYAQPENTVGQSTTQVNNVYDSPGSYVSNYASNSAGQGW